MAVSYGQNVTMGMLQAPPLFFAFYLLQRPLLAMLKTAVSNPSPVTAVAGQVPTNGR